MQLTVFLSIESDATVLSSPKYQKIFLKNSGQKLLEELSKKVTDVFLWSIGVARKSP